MPVIGLDAFKTGTPTETKLPEGYNDTSELQTYYDRQLKTLTEMYSDLMDYNERLIVCAMR